MDFVRDPEKNVLLCPAGEELRFMGEYPTDSGRGGTYVLFGRSDCTGCPLKERCTQGKGRRVKIPRRSEESETPAVLAEPPVTSCCDAELVEPQQADDVVALIRALEQRMAEHGAELMRLRGTTVELVNAHLKQHGLARLHVHGLARCAVVLTLACIGHNLSKWAARLAAVRMGLSP